MGEAKRRRSLLGRELPGVGVNFDLRTGRAGEAPMRFGGSIRSVIAGKGAVPCGGCVACCYHPCVGVHPEDERPEDLARLDLVTREDGVIVVRKRSDGACVHLGERGCTVYEHRPRACRLYDCRKYAMIGVLDSYAGGRKSPGWRFDARTPDDRALMVSLQMAGLAAVAEMGDRLPAVEEILAAAMEKLPKMAKPATELLARLDRMSAEERGRLAQWLHQQAESALAKARTGAGVST